MEGLEFKTGELEALELGSRIGHGIEH